MADDTKERMQLLARSIDAQLPEGFGFCLLVFPFGEPDGKRLNYVSNAARTDVLSVMKEFLIRAGYSRDWMRHLP